MQSQKKAIQQSYAHYADSRAKRSHPVLDCFRAFMIGGSICAFGQALFSLYSSLSIEEDTSRLLVSVSLIFLTALLTGLGVFDKIARFAGAGTLVPITGFANSVVSPAIDSKSEGWILGLGAKIFLIAGPVILYGVLASVGYGILYALCTLCH